MSDNLQDPVSGDHPDAVKAALKALSEATATGQSRDYLTRSAQKWAAVVAVRAASPVIAAQAAAAERERIRLALLTLRDDPTWQTDRWAYIAAARLIGVEMEES